MMYYIMHRTQLLLHSWQHEALKAMSERQGRSIAELVREILTERLGGASARLDAIAGIGDDPRSRGRDHDRYLYAKRKR